MRVTYRLYLSGFLSLSDMFFPDQRAITVLCFGSERKENYLLLHLSKLANYRDRFLD